MRKMELSIEELKIKHVAALLCPRYSKRVARLQLILGSAMLHLFAAFDAGIPLSNDKKRLSETSIRAIGSYAKSAGKVLSHFRTVREYLRLRNELPPHFAAQIRRLLGGANAVS